MDKEMRLEDRYSTTIGWSDADGCFVARIPQLPFTGAHGDTFEEALENARDAVASTLEALRETGDPIPEPSQCA